MHVSQFWMERELLLTVYGLHRELYLALGTKSINCADEVMEGV